MGGAETLSSYRHLISLRRPLEVPPGKISRDRGDDTRHRLYDTCLSASANDLYTQMTTASTRPGREEFIKSLDSDSEATGGEEVREGTRWRQTPRAAASGTRARSSGHSDGLVLSDGDKENYVDAKRIKVTSNDRSRSRSRAAAEPKARPPARGRQGRSETSRPLEAIQGKMRTAATAPTTFSTTMESKRRAWPRISSRAGLGEDRSARARRADACELNKSRG